MIHLLLDCDEFLTASYLSKLKSGLGDADMIDLNTTELQGTSTSAADIIGHGTMMPFLAEKRLVMVHGYLKHLDGRMAASKGSGSAAHGEAAQLIAGFDELDTCELIFASDSIDKRRQLWKGFTLPKTDKRDEQKIPGIADLIKAKRVQQPKLAAPDARELGRWIQQRAKEKEIPIDGRAIRMLADFVGVNLRALDNELEKLAAYASGRPITPDDVKLLVSDASEALIWDLTDALSQRNGRQAMHSLYELRRGDANAFYLLTMIARQFRIMIKVKEATRLNGGGNEYDIAKMVKESAYPVKKAMQQSRKYGAEELDGVMEQLLEADYAMKTGADPETTIDVLVAELTQPRSTQ